MGFEIENYLCSYRSVYTFGYVSRTDKRRQRVFSRHQFNLNFRSCYKLVDISFQFPFMHAFELIKQTTGYNEQLRTGHFCSL